MSIESGRLKYYRRLKTSRFNFGFIIRNCLFRKILWDIWRAWSGAKRRSGNRGNETSKNRVIQHHQINSYFQLNHEMEKNYSFFISAVRIGVGPAKGGGRSEALLFKLKWEFSSIEAQMKNGVVFDLFVRWKVFYSFLFSSGYALLAFTAHKKS